jgi:hypothetical protein
MSWPKKFIKGARPGLKRLAQVTSDSATNADYFFLNYMLSEISVIGSV